MSREYKHTPPGQILSFASFHCTEQRGKPIDPSSTQGDVSTMVDVHDKKRLKQLVWAVYDGMLLPGDPLPLQGCQDWV